MKLAKKKCRQLDMREITLSPAMQHLRTLQIDNLEKEMQKIGATYLNQFSEIVGYGPHIYRCKSKILIQT